MTREKTPKSKKRTRAKPVSLYGIPFEDAVEGLLKTKPPTKKKSKTRKEIKNGRRQ